MSAVELLKQATRQACQEMGSPWPDAADEEFSNHQIARVADVFAELVLAQHTSELEREAALMRARMDRLEAANKAWSDKTDWVQSSAQVSELGLHRADVLRARLKAALAHEPAAELVEYILQDNVHNRLTPRVVDIAYSAFMIAKQGKNKDDGGPCDWFNDTKPMVMKQLAKIKKDLAEKSTPAREPALHTVQHLTADDTEGGAI